MSKKRIHQLAKEYGMTGKDLAGKLRDLGFTHVKSHMTALDEFEELSVQGVLEAHGYSRSHGDGSSENDLGAGVIRRKKKKKGSDDVVDTPRAVTAISSEAPTVEPVTESDAETPVETPVESTEVEHEPVAEAPVTPHVQDQEPTTIDVEAAEPEEVKAVEAGAAPEDEPIVEVEPVAPAAPVVMAEAPPAPVVEEPVPVVEQSLPETGVETPVSDAPVDAVAETPVEAVLKPVESATVKDAVASSEVASQVGDEPKTPAKTGAVKKGTGPAGKVVGFIDLSKIQSAPKQSESRRLRSRDDVMPDVRPTLRHDSRNNMLRGDRGSRNTLTAAQLREREAGRYKRHARGGQGGRGRGRGAGSRPIVDGSPYAGQTLRIEHPVTVKKLAESMAIKGNQLLKIAFSQLGFGAVTITTTLDDDTAQLLAEEFEVTIEFVQLVEAEQAMIESLQAKRAAVADGDLIKRNPTVAFLGHVDHGKTTLIDKIRSSGVADSEHGGITQHIGAYRVRTDLGHHVTIIDTPGHAAFTGMRARGAKAVDVVVLVVAADSGVQPQTEEALAHAKAAKVPVVVALNKIDRPEANPQKTMEQLSTIGIIPEDWGGETAIMPVSGITGDGLQDLLERIFLESEMLELNCHPDGAASGVVLEAEVQQGKGIVAHLLVQDGTLERGNVILAGEGYGKVRSILDDFGNVIESAGP
ncbi:MAG: translation initiation factor IF-2, partial [Candidatus Paceibacteria bacterium]